MAVQGAIFPASAPAAVILWGFIYRFGKTAVFPPWHMVPLSWRLIALLQREIFNPNPGFTPYMPSDGMVSLRLFAQVRAARPVMVVDEENLVRNNSLTGPTRKIILGDVGQAFLRALGPSDPPILTEIIGFDEQKWEISANSFGTDLSIKSNPYWGFGLFTNCFLNEINIKGRGSIVDRIVYDSLSFLGRNPWEPTWTSKFERKMGMDVEKQAEIWRESQSRSERMMREILRELSLIVREHEGIELGQCAIDLEMARAALDDRNSHAFERAISRVSSQLNIQGGDPWGVLIESDESEIIDLTES